MFNVENMTGDDVPTNLHPDMMIRPPCYNDHDVLGTANKVSRLLSQLACRKAALHTQPVLQ